MFQACDFTYAGVPASMFGLFLADIGGKGQTDSSFGNKANIVETRIARRVRPIHFGVRYHDEPLKFNLVFCGEEPMDRYQTQEVADWLTGYQDYQWLSICQPDLEHIRFRCLIQTLTPVSVGWYPVGFEAQVICDCPYGYGYPFSETVRLEGGGAVTRASFHNSGTANVPLQPKLLVRLRDGCTQFKARNLTAGCELILEDIPAGCGPITIDNENGIITSSGGGDLYRGFNYRFFSLVRGDNTLEFEGDGEVQLDGMCLYNAGA